MSGYVHIIVQLTKPCFLTVHFDTYWRMAGELQHFEIDEISLVLESEEVLRYFFNQTNKV